MSEKELSQKVDLALADLATNGGLLNPEQNDQFIRDIMDQPTLINTVRTVPMSGPTREINKIGFGTRILHAARQTAAGAPASRYLLEAERSKPATRKIELTTSTVMAEIPLPYETLEDNIERGNMESTILTLIAERAALDLEELLINGDTASGDAFLALQDGVLKLTTSNVVNAIGLAIDPDLFNTVVLAMPKKYRQNRAALRHFMPADIEQNYRNDQAKRGTGLGDATLVGNAPISLYGSPMKPVAMLPDTNGVYGNPLNIIMGIQRNIRIETWKDIRAQEVVIVLTARVAIAVEEELALVRVNNLGV